VTLPAFMSSKSATKNMSPPVRKSKKDINQF
jgi:hypothetical protein